MVDRIWPAALAGEANSVSSLSASACHIGGPIDVNPGVSLRVSNPARVKGCEHFGFMQFLTEVHYNEQNERKSLSGSREFI